MQFTEQQISAVARVLSDRAAGDCGVHKEDNWDICSENYIEDAKAALAALSAAAPQVVSDERSTYDISTPMHIHIISLESMLLNYRCAATPEKVTEFKSAILKAVSDIAAPVKAQEPKPFAGPGAWFSVDVLGNPMREYSPGEWENCVWPSAAPGQAQEPVAYALTPAEIEAIDDEVLEKGLRGDDGKRQGYCVLFAQAVVAANNAKRAPVQPVAVPDVLGKAFVTLESNSGRYSIVMKFNQKSDAFEVHSFLLGAGGKEYNSAAPAAQGDAKDAERLDWLVKQHGSGYQIGGHKLMGWFYITPSSGSASQLFNTPREAIDAAIAAKAAS